MQSDRSDAVLNTASTSSSEPMSATTTSLNKNLAMRFATAGVAVPVILWMLLIAPHAVWATFVLVPAMSVGAHELFRMTLPKQPLLQAWGVLCTLFVGFIFYLANSSDAPSPLLMPALLTLVVASLLVSLSRPVPSEAAGVRMAWLVAGPFYIGGTISTLAAMHTLPRGGQWVVLSMMLAWFADTAGYFAGRFLGGKVFGPQKMSPNISPNKTWEGAVGAMFGCLVAVCLAHFWYLPDLPLWGGLGLALVAGPLGICGDLVESLVKRSTGTKDSGKIVPGHGGLIDRIDALMFTATTTLIYARYILPL
jgi:phosphatidate cytidylyltransferase